MEQLIFEEGGDGLEVEENLSYKIDWASLQLEGK